MSPKMKKRKQAAAEEKTRPDSHLKMLSANFFWMRHWQYFISSYIITIKSSSSRISALGEKKWWLWVYIIQNRPFHLVYLSISNQKYGCQNNIKSILPLHEVQHTIQNTTESGASLKMIFLRTPQIFHSL